MSGYADKVDDSPLMEEDSEDNLVQDDDMDTADDSDSPGFTAQQLAKWNFLTSDGDEGYIAGPKKKGRSWIESTFALEHRGRFHYMLWWVIVTAWNIPAMIYFYGSVPGFNRLESPHKIEINTLFAVNVLTCVITRNELFVWSVYLILGNLAKPLPWQGFCGKLKKFILRVCINIGGIHTGSVFWFLVNGFYLLIYLPVNEAFKAQSSWSLDNSVFRNNYIITCFVVFCFVMMAGFATPLWRHKPRWHDYFEYTHRYFGWSAAIALIVDMSLALASPEYGSDLYSATSANFWIIWVVIGLILWPWVLMIYYVDASILSPSNMVCLVTWSPKPWFAVPGTAGKVSQGSVFGQFHSFALLADVGGDPNRALMGIAKGGDWTTEVIAKGLEVVENRASTVKRASIARGDPADKKVAVKIDSSVATHKLTFRRFGVPGFMWLVRSYKRVVCIGTGAGVAPIASYLPNPMREMLILWIGRSFEKTYGPLYPFVTAYKNSILIDSRAEPGEDNPFSPAYDLKFTSGGARQAQRRATVVRYGEKRPDIPSLAIAAVEMFKAEAVFIISGPKPTYAMCHAVWKVGVHGYGATWDS